MKLNYSKTLIPAISACLLLWCCAIVVVLGSVSPFISCYAVDSSGKIYIQNEDFIRVYSNGIAVGKINSQTSRAYKFTIENDTILVATPVGVHVMDLNGEVLDTFEESRADTYRRLRSPTKDFHCKNGDTYSLKGRLLYSRIEKNAEEVVYQITPIAFVVKIAMYVMVPCGVTGFVHIVKFFIKKRYE